MWSVFSILYYFFKSFQILIFLFINKKFADQENPRGLGTDIAVVGSMVFLAQFILSLCMGSIIDLIGSHSVTVYAASFLSACSAWFATKVHYIEDQN
jgi:MFS family permease